MSSADVTLSMGELTGLRKMLDEGRGLYLKVGVLGDYAGRTSDQTGVKRKSGTVTNPQLGLWHEFGNMKRKLPERSFLRMPLMAKLPGALAGADWWAWIERGGIGGILNEIGNLSLGIIAQAFATGGFGQWAAWSYSYAKFRERLARAVLRGKGRFVGPVQPGLILMLTGQLERSVTYAVVRQGSPQTAIMEEPA